MKLRALCTLWGRRINLNFTFGKTSTVVTSKVTSPKEHQKPLKPVVRKSDPAGPVPVKIVDNYVWHSRSHTTIDLTGSSYAAWSEKSK